MTKPGSGREGTPGTPGEQPRTSEKAKDSPLQGGSEEEKEEFLVAKYESTIDEDDPNSGIDPDKMQVNPGF